MKSDIDEDIAKYYSSIDSPTINNLYRDDYFKNLIKLSTVTDLYIFCKKNKRWILKEKQTLLNECKKTKKREIKKSSYILGNLAKLCPNNSYEQIKLVNQDLEIKIKNIDNIISMIDDNNDDYIEMFSNC
jgi:hypothetical protein